MLIQNLLVPKVVADNLELLIISVTNQVNTCKHHIGLFIVPPLVVHNVFRWFIQLPCWFRPIMIFYFCVNWGV